MMPFDEFTKSFLTSILEESDPYAFESDTAGDDEDYLKYSKKKKKEEKETQVQPFHGFSLTPEKEAGIKTALKYGGDDPETSEVETSQDASWQGVNAASFNEIKRQRIQQELQQGMRR